MENIGCHQLNRVLTANNKRGEKWYPTLCGEAPHGGGDEGPGPRLRSDDTTATNITCI
jgi:hypothetical protein